MQKPRFVIPADKQQTLDTLNELRENAGLPRIGAGKPKALFEIPLRKASVALKEDGEMTPKGLDVATRYARRWVKKSERDLELERLYPELGGYFYDIRSDPKLARSMAA